MNVIGLYVLFATFAVFGTRSSDAGICDDILGGLWVRDETDCMIAYHCGIDGEVVQQVKCNESQIWSKLASACVWEYDPERDDCHGLPQLSLVDDPRCHLKTGNNPDPEDCSRFVSCQNGTLIAIQRCGDGTLYFPKNDSCEFAHVVHGSCGSRRIPETFTIAEEDPICAGRTDVVEDPKSCVHFYQCQFGKQVMRHRCPPNTAFSMKSLQCEWNNKVHCESSGRPMSVSRANERSPSRQPERPNTGRDRDYQFGGRRERKPFLFK